ncbi:MAG: hypothetical protein PUK24_04680 [Elusimicrobia bacterium]|nr:hypothetical protein [Elusimicrobiota bacterium]MDD7578825.1 hypothetical protein [Elusimicrobiota bacterium]MDY6039521.1 hypothetical protein [Elusimicrobiaceae bacterium]
MKINTAFLLSVLFFIPALCPAQLTVVRVDGQKVYIDTSVLSRNVSKGETFKIILSSERLVNPKTGKDLGPLYTYSPEGKITEVQPMYAVGELPKGTKAAVGQEAVLEPLAAAEPAAKTVKTQDAKPSSIRKTTYEPVEQEIVSLSTAAVTAPEAENIVTVSKKGQITVWTPAGDKLEQNLSFQIPAGKTPLTVSAYPAQNAQTADIFVTVYDASREKISTLVLSNQNGRLAQTDTLPYFVKELGCGAEKTLWAQKPFVSGAKPGNARKLAYQNGKFVLTESTLNTGRNWLTGVNEADGSLVITAQNGVIRRTSPDGKKAESKSLFASAPNRVKYKQEILKFYPSVQVFGPADNRVYAAVENTAKLGLLSDTFGQYQSGKIHFMSFEKGRLNITDTAETDGFMYDTACSARAVLAAEVLPDGTSSVVEFFK